MAGQGIGQTQQHRWSCTARVIKTFEGKIEVHERDAHVLPQHQPVVSMSKDGVTIGCTYVERGVVEMLYKSFQKHFPIEEPLGCVKIQ